MQAHPVRLSPGDDLRAALEDVLRQTGMPAAFVIQGIGSLGVAQLRFAGNDEATELRDDLEILTLAGSLSSDGAHLHMSVADPRGRVFGGARRFSIRRLLASEAGGRCAAMRVSGPRRRAVAPGVSMVRLRVRAANAAVQRIRRSSRGSSQP